MSTLTFLPHCLAYIYELTSRPTQSQNLKQAGRCQYLCWGLELKASSSLYYGKQCILCRNPLKASGIFSKWQISPKAPLTFIEGGEDAVGGWKYLEQSDGMVSPINLRSLPFHLCKWPAFLHKIRPISTSLSINSYSFLSVYQKLPK